MWYAFDDLFTEIHAVRQAALDNPLLEDIDYELRRV